MGLMSNKNLEKKIKFPAFENSEDVTWHIWHELNHLVSEINKLNKNLKKLSEIKEEKFKIKRREGKGNKLSS